MGAAASQKELATPMKILYSLFPRAPGGKGNEEYDISKMSPLKAALAAKNYGVDSAAIQERNVVLESLTKMITVADNADTQRLHEKDKENADKRTDRQEAITLERGRIYIGCVIS